MKPKNQSPYSKMYLIPPNMYEKLLVCLDEKETRLTEDLNIDKESVEERPSERQIEMLNQEALNPEINDDPQSEVQMTQAQEYEEPKEADEVLNDTGDPQVIAEDDVDMPIRELRNREIRGRISFNKPPSKTNTCEICLKVFKRPYGLQRHLATVHQNLKKKTDPSNFNSEVISSEETIPSQLNVSNVIPDTDQEMSQEIFQPRRQKKSCPISADTTDRVIPELYFKPPRKPIIVPQMKKQMLLVPQIKKREVFLKPSIFKRKGAPPLKAKDSLSNTSKISMKKFPMKKAISEPDELMNFQDWTESKKRGVRSSSEAKLREKPAKWKFTEW